MDYDLNVIMDTIDQYISVIMEKYTWGYSIPYSLAGMYGCHVNNVAYLNQTHRTKSKDMKIIFESLSEEKRTQYDYDNLEKVDNDYQNKVVDDTMVIELLRSELEGKKLVAILPGISAELSRNEIKQNIEATETITIGINAVVPEYEYQYLFFSNKVKYEFAKETHPLAFAKAKIIFSSNIKTEADERELIINYNDVLKRGWKYFDNSFIMFLRLMNKVGPSEIWIAGFDGYLEKQNKYADTTLKPVLEDIEYINIQNEIEDMLIDFIETTDGTIKMKCITESPFESVIQNSNGRQ